MSPARPRDGPYVVACLTQHQRQVKGLIKEAIRDTPDIKLSMAADTVELWKTGK